MFVWRQDLRDRTLLYGLQGAGNVIVQKIIRDIVGPLPTGKRATRAAHRHARRVEAISALNARVCGAAAPAIGYARPWQLNGYFLDGTDIVIFVGLRSDIVLAEAVWGSHCPPQRGDIAAYLRHGGRVAVLLRHPLDVMTSFATKSTPLGPGRRERRDLLLADPEFVASFAWQIAAFWRRVATTGSAMRVLRYEDLIADPLTFINSVQGWLGRHSTAVDAIAAQIGTAELSVPGHLFEARTESWLGSLPDHMLGYFEAIRAIATAHGYSWPSAAARDPTPSANFHVAGYSFGDRRLRQYLRNRSTLHRIAGMQFLADPLSPLLARVRAALKADPEAAATMRRE